MPGTSLEKILFVFRHGETDWNREGRFQGSTDIPLNETGRLQADALRRFFARNPVDAFMTSDLVRALETAEIANRDLRAPIVSDRRLRETNLGVAEGLTRQEIVETFGTEILRQWAETFPPDLDYRFPSGESKAEHLARLLAAIEHNVKSHPHSTWGVATHGGAIRRLIHHLVPNLTSPVMVANAAVYEMRFDLVKGHLRLIDLEPKLTS
ncbi:MAG: histidine phosphatase family protein [Bdellovibrionota bacterium]